MYNYNIRVENYSFIKLDCNAVCGVQWTYERIISACQLMLCEQVLLDLRSAWVFIKRL